LKGRESSGVKLILVSSAKERLPPPGAGYAGSQLWVDYLERKRNITWTGKASPRKDQKNEEIIDRHLNREYASFIGKRLEPGLETLGRRYGSESKASSILLLKLEGGQSPN